MSFESLSERLIALQEANAQLREFIDRLATIKFEPGSIPLDSEDGGVIQELTADIQDTITAQDEDLELLLEEVEDVGTGRYQSPAERRKEEMEYAVKKVMKELKLHQVAFRQAQLAAKRNLKAAQKAERDALIRSYREPLSAHSEGPTTPVTKQARKPARGMALTKEEREVNAASDLTAALRRTHEIMSNEVQRSQFAQQTLQESTAALAQLSENYSTLDTMLSKSKNLLGTLMKSQKSDTWYLETAFYVLCVTICWLIFRRLLYGPAWWILWFTPRMFIKSWIGVFTFLGLFGGDPEVAVNHGTAAVTTEVVHNRATRQPVVDMSGNRAPTVNVGGGGRGAPMRHAEPSPASASGIAEESISEQVGKIIDDSNAEAEGVEFDNSEEPAGEEMVQDQPNSKKRMWDENKEAKKYEKQTTKDEL